MEYGDCKSWGSKLKDKYADHYACVALLTSGGSALELSPYNQPAYIRNMRPCYPSAEMDGAIFLDRVGSAVGNGMALSTNVWDKVVGYMRETQKKVNAYMDQLNYY